jgi:hypothetical protein
MSENKQTSVWDIFRKEYKYESLLLVFLSVVIMVVSAMIIGGTLTIRESFPVLGNFPTISAIVFMVAGFIGLVVGSWPIFKPSFKEARRLTPPTKRTYGDHVVKVFSFVLGLTVIFLIYDTVIAGLFGLAM